MLAQLSRWLRNHSIGSTIGWLLFLGTATVFWWPGRIEANNPPPVPPSNLVVTATTTSQISLSWQNNSGSGTSFWVFRWQTADQSDWAQVATVSDGATTWTDTGLAESSLHHYTVYSYKNSRVSATSSNTADGVTLLEAPSNLGSTSTTSRIDLSWTDNSSVESGFRVERKPYSGGSFSEIASTGPNVTTYSNSALSEFAWFYYRTRVYDGTGSSAYSNEILAMTNIKEPTNLTATTASSTQINLTWNENSSVENNILVERRTGSGAFQQIASLSANASSYSDTSVIESTQYTYRVRAYYAVLFASAYSNEAIASTYPAAPTNLTSASNTPDTINISWTDNSNGESGFKIERKPTNSGSFVQIETVNPNITGYSNSGLPEFTSYRYRVRAYSNSGDSSPSNEVLTQTAIRTPMSLDATAVSPTQANLTWTENSGVESNIIVERKAGSDSFQQVASLPANTSSYSDGSLTEGTQYSFRVRAYHVSGNTSGYSNEDAISTPPHKPGSLTAASVSQTQIDLSWTDNSGVEDSILVERKVDGGSFEQIAALAANAVSYSDSSLAESAHYTYRVRVYDLVFLASDYSNEASDWTRPASPSNPVTSAVSTSRIDLTWSDNASGESSYKVERTAHGASGWLGIASLGSDATKFEDSAGLDAGTKYDYRIRASGPGGNSSYSPTAIGATLLNSDFHFTRPTALNTNASADSGNDETVRIAANGDGVWVAVWASNENLGGAAGTDWDILTARSTDGGSTWSAPALLNSTGSTDNASCPHNDDREPAICTDRQGSWVVIWHSNRDLNGAGTDDDLFYARSTDNGASWSAARLLTPTFSQGTRTGNFDPSIAVDPSGTWLVVWSSSPVTSPSEEPLFPSAALWESHILVSRSTDAGATWSEPRLLKADRDHADTHGDYYPAIAGDGTGRWIAVWFSDEDMDGSGGDYDLYFSQSLDGGLDWTEARPLLDGFRTDSGSDVFPHIDTDGHGNWIVGYLARPVAGGELDIHAAFSGDGGDTWNGPVVVDDLPGDNESLSLASDKFGTWVLAWHSEAPSVGGHDLDWDGDLLVSVSRDAGRTWTPAEPANTDAAGDYRNENRPAIATDRRGRWIVASESAPTTLGLTLFGNDSDILYQIASIAPPSPAFLQANAISSSRIDLRWEDNSTSASGFKLERREEGTESWTLVATLAVDAPTTYSDTNLQPSTLYNYRIYAYGGPGGDSIPSTASALTGPDGAEFGNSVAFPLWAEAGSQQNILLSWPDLFTNNDGYEIQRTTDPLATNEPNAARWELPLRKVSGGQTSFFEDKPLSGETTYYYRIRAYAGDPYSGAKSNWSSLAFATTAISKSVLNWTSYLGGAGVENVKVTATAERNKSVYVVGTTTSAGGGRSSQETPYFVTPRARYNDEANEKYYGENDEKHAEPLDPTGGVDGFLAKFNEDGKLQWVTLFGGPGEDVPCGVVVQNPLSGEKENVWVAGTTNSLHNAIGGRSQIKVKLPSNPGAMGDGTKNIFLINFGDTSQTTDKEWVWQPATTNRNAGFTLLQHYASIRWGIVFGGNEDDAAVALIESSGRIYITGTTRSSNFPAVDALKGTLVGSRDIFVASIKAQFDHNNIPTYEEALLKSSFLGANETAEVTAIAASDSGVTLVGWTTSTASSTGCLTPASTAFQPASMGGEEGFVIRLKMQNDPIELDVQSFLGSSGNDRPSSLVDDGDFLYIAGSTNWNDFLCFPPIPIHVPARLFTGTNGTTEAFILKLNKSLSSDALSWHTFFGGSGNETGPAIQVSRPSIYLIGTTTSADFPLIGSGSDPTKPTNNAYAGGASDAFIARFRETDGKSAWSTCLGGSGADSGAGITDGSGDILFVAGDTDSPDLPNQLSDSDPDGRDVFVGKITPSSVPAPGAVVPKLFVRSSMEPPPLVPIGVLANGANSGYHQTSFSMPCASNDQMTLTAPISVVAPATHRLMQFGGWSINGDFQSSNPISIPMNGDRSVVAVYVPAGGTPALAAPSDLSLVEGVCHEGHVALHWTNNAPSATSFLVERLKLSDGASTWTSASTTETFFLDTSGFEQGRSYLYQVSARVGAQSSAPSPAAIVAPTTSGWCTPPAIIDPGKNGEDEPLQCKAPLENSSPEEAFDQVDASIDEPPGTDLSLPGGIASGGGANSAGGATALTRLRHASRGGSGGSSGGGGSSHGSIPGGLGVIGGAGGSRSFGNSTAVPMLAADTAPRGSVSPFNGALVVTATDMRLKGRGFDFEWVRTYRSRASIHSAQGLSWDFSYNIYLENYPDPNAAAGTPTRLALWSGNSRGDVYTRDGTTDTYARSEAAASIKRSTTTDSFGESPNYTMFFPDGTRWVFNLLAQDSNSLPGAGKIRKIVDRFGNSMAFTYVASVHPLSIDMASRGSSTFLPRPLYTSRLDKIIDTLGREITFQYYDTASSVTNDFAPGFISSIRSKTLSGQPDWRIDYFYYNGQANVPGNRGDLKAVTVMPTGVDGPNGSSGEGAFAAGKTTTYLYVPEIGSSGMNLPEIHHNLKGIIDPRGQQTLSVEYYATVDDTRFDRVSALFYGASNSQERIGFDYQELAPCAESNGATRRTLVLDEAGFASVLSYSAENTLLRKRVFKSGGHVGFPSENAAPSEFFQTDYTYDFPHSRLTAIAKPRGNQVRFTYESDTDTMRIGNVTKIEYASTTPEEGVIAKHFAYNGSSCCGFDFVTQYTDPNGNFITYTYADKSLLQSVRYFPNGANPQTASPLAQIDYEYNAYGQLTAVTHPASNLDSAHPQRRRDEYDYKSWAGYPTFLDRVTLNRGANELITRYTYDTNDRGTVTSIIDPLSRVTSFRLNQLDQVTRVTYPEGYRASTGGPISNAYTVDYYYDGADNLERIDVRNITPEGPQASPAYFTTRLEHDARNRLTKIRRQAETHDVTTSYEYSHSSTAYTGTPAHTVLIRRPEAVSIDNGATPARQPNNTITRVYDDPRGLLTQSIQAAGDAAQAASTIYEYDPNGNLKRVHQGHPTPIPSSEANDLHEYVLERDGFDRLSMIMDPNQNKTWFHRDLAGRIVSVRVVGQGVNDVAGASGEVDLSRVNLFYDAMDRLVAEYRDFFVPAVPGATPGTVNPETWITDDADHNHQVFTSYAYTPNSQLASVTDDNNHTTTLQYDPFGRTREVRDAKGNGLLLSYDAASNVISIEEQEKSGDTAVSPDASFTTTYSYDGINRLTAVHDPRGSDRTSSYDSRGNVTLAEDARGLKTRYTYDWLSRLIATVRDMDGDGAFVPGGDDIGSLQEWDDDSRLIAQIDDNGNATRYAYDALDRLLLVRMADGTLEMAGTLSGPTAVSWSNGAARPSSLGDFASGYDRHHNLALRTDANGTVVGSTFDKLNRVLTRGITVGAGVAEATIFEGFSYDGLSRLKYAQTSPAAQDPSSAGVSSFVWRDYDSLGNLISEGVREINGEAAPVTPLLTTLSRHDGVGNKIGLTYPGGRTVRMEYDELDRLNAVYDVPSTTPIAAYAYIGPSRVLARNYPLNGTRMEMAYGTGAGDANNRAPSAIRHLRTGATPSLIDERLFTWDANYNRTSSTSTNPNLATPVTVTRNFTYDAADQLILSTNGPLEYQFITVTQPASPYTFDGVGNRRTTVELGGAVRTYLQRSTDPPLDAPVNQDTNSFLGAAPPPGSSPGSARSYWYDERGNMTARKSADHVMPDIYFYDYRDRIVRIDPVEPGPAVIQRYDALNRRIMRQDSAGNVTRYLYDGWRVIEERDGSGTTTEATYVYGADIDEVLTMRRGGADYFYHADDQMNVLKITDAGGGLVEGYEYEDYGFPCFYHADGSWAGYASGIGNRMLHQGQWWNDWMYHNRMRNRLTRAGRFMSRDPIGVWGDRFNLGNASTFVGNNPWSRRDPYGLATGDNWKPTILGNFFPAMWDNGSWAAERAIELPAEISGRVVESVARWGARKITALAGPAYSAEQKDAIETDFADGGNWLGRGLWAMASCLFGGGEAASGVKAAQRAEKAAKEGLYEFLARTGKTYVGQSEDIGRRIGEHLREGRLLEKDLHTLKTTEVLGGRTAREVQEQLRINDLGGVKMLENQRNPIGRDRQHLIPPKP